MLKNKLVDALMSVVLVISFVVGLRLVNSKSEDDEYVYVAMGDFLTSVEGSYSDVYRSNHKIDKYNKFLSRKSMTSSDLLRFLTVNASIVYDGVNMSLSKVISMSDIITISVGYNDVMNNVRYNSITNQYVYDETLVDRVLSSLQSNIYDIASQIYEYNSKADVYVLSSYYPYPSVDNTAEELYVSLNNSIKEACEDSGAKYVDIEGVSVIEHFDEDFIPNVIGMGYIADVIK